MSSYIVLKETGWINPGVLVVDNRINDRVEIVRGLMTNRYAKSMIRIAAGYQQCCESREKRMNPQGIFHISMSVWCMSVWSDQRFMNSIWLTSDVSPILLANFPDVIDPFQRLLAHLGR